MYAFCRFARVSDCLCSFFSFCGCQIACVRTYLTTPKAVALDRLRLLFTRFKLGTRRDHKADCLLVVLHTCIIRCLRSTRRSQIRGEPFHESKAWPHACLQRPALLVDVRKSPHTSAKLPRNILNSLCIRCMFFRFSWYNRCKGDGQDC